MAEILFQNETVPATPAGGFTYLYIDSGDKHAKTIDDSGTIVDLAGGASPGGSAGDLQFNNGSGGLNGSSSINYNGTQFVLNTQTIGLTIQSSGHFSVYNSFIHAQLYIDNDTEHAGILTASPNYAWDVHGDFACYNQFLDASDNTLNFVEYGDSQNSAVSSGNTGRIRYNNDTTIFEKSENGGGWVPLSGLGSANWGSIGGTLSSQTDLQSALDAKEDVITPNTGWSTTGLSTNKVLTASSTLNDVLNYLAILQAAQITQGLLGA